MFIRAIIVVLIHGCQNIIQTLGIYSMYQRWSCRTTEAKGNLRYSARNQCVISSFDKISTDLILIVCYSYTFFVFFSFDILFFSNWFLFSSSQSPFVYRFVFCLYENIQNIVLVTRRYVMLPGSFVYRNGFFRLVF